MYKETSKHLFKKNNSKKKKKGEKFLFLFVNLSKIMSITFS